MRKLLLSALVALASTLPLHAQDMHVRIGVLNDQNALFADITGQGSIVAAQMAIDDFTKDRKDITADLVSADHQNKPDVGVTIGRRWFEEGGVDAIVDVPGSAIALALSQVATDMGKVLLDTGAGASQISGSACQPTTVQWAYDTWSQANTVGTAVVENGGDSWFILTADYAFGHALEADLTTAVEKGGGKVLGSVRAPLGTPDFSSFLLQAQASGAKVIGLALAGVDLINVIKQANEFGIVSAGQSIATPVIFISDVKSLGLETAKGLVLATPYYWDHDDATRAFADRFAEKFGGKKPTFLQGAVYSVTLHYLKSVEAAKSKDATAVMAKMHELPTDDPVFGKGYLAKNNRHVHPLYLYRVKTPEQSKGEWDLYEPIATIEAEQTVKPVAESGCKLAN